MNIVSVTQLEKDTILVCYDSKLNVEGSSAFMNVIISLDLVKVVNLQGKLKSSKKQASEVHFDFSINCIGIKLVS